MDKATPRPWAINNKQICGAFDEGAIIAHMESKIYYEQSEKQEMQANANLIVKAVNSHDALVEALESAKRVFESGNLETQDAEETANQIIEALNLAKGEQS